VTIQQYLLLSLPSSFSSLRNTLPNPLDLSLAHLRRKPILGHARVLIVAGLFLVLSYTAAASTEPSLASIACEHASMTGGGYDPCVVTLTAAAGTSDVTVSLESNDGSATLPATMVILAGTTNRWFHATVSAVSKEQNATFTAKLGTVSKTFSLELQPESAILKVAASTIAFGDVKVDTPATQSLSLTSSGTAAVTISSAKISGTGYSISGATFPLTLQPGKSATLEVEFDPTKSGAASGTLAIDSNSSAGSSTTVSLSGTGTSSSSAYEVQLHWTAASDSSVPIAGYRVYRATQGSSAYTLLNSSVVTATSYTDSTVQAAVDYDYYIESVDTSGAQSAPSSIISLSVP
jgi:hypothetical protein